MDRTHLRWMSVAGVLVMACLFLTDCSNNTDSSRAKSETLTSRDTSDRDVNDSTSPIEPPSRTENPKAGSHDSLLIIVRGEFPESEQIVLRTNRSSVSLAFTKARQERSLQGLQRYFVVDRGELDTSADSVFASIGVLKGGVKFKSNPKRLLISRQVDASRLPDMTDPGSTGEVDPVFYTRISSLKMVVE